MQIYIDERKPTCIVYQSIELPILYFFLLYICGLLLIIASIAVAIKEENLWISYSIIIYGLLLIYSGIRKITSYVIEIKYDDEALYISKSIRKRNYRKIHWNKITSIRICRNFFTRNSYLIWIDTVQNKQVLPYWLGPPWPGKYERDIREAFFIEVKKKLEEEKEKRKQEAVANIVDINKQTAEQETTS